MNKLILLLAAIGFVFFILMLFFGFGWKPFDWVERGNFITEVFSLIVEGTLLFALIGYYLPERIRRQTKKREWGKWLDTRKRVYRLIQKDTESLFSVLNKYGFGNRNFGEYTKYFQKNVRDEVKYVVPYEQLDALQASLEDFKSNIEKLSEIYAGAMTPGISRALTEALDVHDQVKTCVRSLKYHLHHYFIDGPSLALKTLERCHIAYIWSSHIQRFDAERPLSDSVRAKLTKNDALGHAVISDDGVEILLEENSAHTESVQIEDFPVLIPSTLDLEYHRNVYTGEGLERLELGTDMSIHFYNIRFGIERLLNLFDLIEVKNEITKMHFKPNKRFELTNFALNLDEIYISVSIETLDEFVCAHLDYKSGDKRIKEKIRSRYLGSYSTDYF